MEIVTPDSRELVAQRAYEAVRKIGKVVEYNPEKFVEAKVYTNGYPALLTVEWNLHRDGERTRVDISATSRDELSRAADSALYRFTDTFKDLQVEQLEEIYRRRSRNRKFAIVGIVCLSVICIAVLYLLNAAPSVSAP